MSLQGHTQPWISDVHGKKNQNKSTWLKQQENSYINNMKFKCWYHQEQLSLVICSFDMIACRHWLHCLFDLCKCIQHNGRVTQSNSWRVTWTCNWGAISWRVMQRELKLSDTKGTLPSIVYNVNWLFSTTCRESSIATICIMSILYTICNNK